MTTVIKSTRVKHRSSGNLNNCNQLYTQLSGFYCDFKLTKTTYTLEYMIQLLIWEYNIQIKINRQQTSQRKKAFNMYVPRILAICLKQPSYVYKLSCICLFHSWIISSFLFVSFIMLFLCCSQEFAAMRFLKCPTTK